MNQPYHNNWKVKFLWLKSNFIISHSFGFLNHNLTHNTRGVFLGKKMRHYYCMLTYLFAATMTDQKQWMVNNHKWLTVLISLSMALLYTIIICSNDVNQLYIWRYCSKYAFESSLIFSFYIIYIVLFSTIYFFSLFF
jgi:hypothetical protein